MHKNRISSSIHDDANGTKILYDNLLKRKFSKSHIDGYMQELAQNPFGYLLISDIKVNIVIKNDEQIMNK